MKALASHTDFEKMIGRSPLDPGETIPPAIIIYFGASWCGPCQRIDLVRLEQSTPHITWLKCDVDQNDYTGGFCGVRRIPGFVAVANKSVVGTVQLSNTEKILEWATQIFRT